MSGAGQPFGRRQRVSESLSRSPKLAGVYRQAILAFDSPPEHGSERARVSVISHCMRELMNGAPSALTESSEDRVDPSSAALLSRLPRLLADHPDLDLSADQDVVPVPREVAVHLDQLIRARTQEDGRNRRNTAALIGSDSSSNRSAIEQWQNAYRFFVRWAHLDRDEGRERTLPSDEAIESHIRVVEDVIEVQTAAFFDNLHSLQDLLDEINEVEEGTA